MTIQSYLFIIIIINNQYVEFLLFFFDNIHIKLYHKNLPWCQTANQPELISASHFAFLSHSQGAA